MRTVWTFWSKPFRAHYKRFWRSHKHHLLAWILSVQTARKHYPNSSLFTDDEGARMLVDSLGLEFTHVSIGLKALNKYDPEWWVLGKLFTYRAQTRPFIHLDNDVFLWNRLPRALESAPVFAQNPEVFKFEEGSLYRVERFHTALNSMGGWMPEEWRWYHSRRGNTAISCGLLGGCQVEFLRYYADLAITAILHSHNQRAWTSLGTRDNILMEQYFLAACIEYHRNTLSSRYRGVAPRYLFQSSDHAFDQDHAARAGYTHLIGDAKRHEQLADRLERRVQRDYPDHYERCIRYLEQQGGWQLLN